MSACSSHRHLRSAQSGQLLVPRTTTKYGDRSFTVQGPWVWNSLVAELRVLLLLKHSERDWRRFCLTHNRTASAFAALLNRELINVLNINNNNNTLLLCCAKMGSRMPTILCWLHWDHRSVPGHPHFFSASAPSPHVGTAWRAHHDNNNRACYISWPNSVKGA